VNGFFVNRLGREVNRLGSFLGVRQTILSASRMVERKQTGLSAPPCSASAVAPRRPSRRFLPPLFLVVFALAASSRAAEYEVEGNIRQRILDVEYQTRFTVYVRDCGWLIRMIDENGTASGYQCEVGSTNGSDIFEYYPHAEGRNPARQPATNIPGPKNSGPVNHQPPSSNDGFIKWGNLPVGLQDRDVVGHLWLMFASQCYWGGLKIKMLTPLYDYKVSVPADPNMTIKVPAEWELLDGPGSLPREASYLGRWEETNGLYRVTGTIMAGATMIPKGFIFEERHAQPYGRGMVLRKRVDAEVTSVRAICSRRSLIPVPGVSTSIVDWRLKAPGRSASLPDYINPVPGRWPTLAESRVLAKTNEERNSTTGRKPPPPARTPPWMVAVICAILLAPLGLFLRGKKA
jgi:hypothetical protein